MEELVQKIDELIMTLNSNSIPLWISIIGVFVPILLSIAVIAITITQNAQNKKLQKMISDKELKVQMHGDILSIYDGHVLLLDAVSKVGDNIASILFNPKLTSQWYNELYNAGKVLYKVNDRAALLLPQRDIDLRNVLKSVLSKYETMMKEVFNYINSGAAEFSRQQAWKTIGAAYKIQINDYNALSSNSKATKEFIKLYSNATINKINDEIKEIRAALKYDKFDKYFEPYLSIYTEQ